MSSVLKTLQLVRPRTLTQLVRTVHDTASQARDLRGSLRELREERDKHERALQQRVEQLSSEVERESRAHREALDRLNALERRVRTLDSELAASRLRESQLRAIMEGNLRLEREETGLAAALKDLDGIARHVTAAVAAAELHDDPFPFAVADDVLPQWLYDALIKGLPPVELFGDRPVNKQQLAVPFGLAPSYSRRVWRFMAKRVVETMLLPAVAEKFRHPFLAWLHQSFPRFDESSLASIPLVSSDGRILLRRPGYYIRPHRDPKWGMITCLFYLARPGDDERWGTELYAVEQDEAAPSVAPHWIDSGKCRLVHEVRFRPNRMLIFLNSRGAHGARIPPDAEPPTLERYAYQFRIGPRGESVGALIDSLPDDVKGSWEGKFGDY